MITLDGVMQSPGAPEEDVSDDFTYGGWIAPYDDEAAAEIMQRLLSPADLLLGRKTFEIWEDYWPNHTDYWPTINKVTKYVLSKTRNSTSWENCVFIDKPEAIENLKSSDGGDIQIWGSGELVRLLLARDWIDELWLMIHPLILGRGKKLFSDSPVAAAFTLVESITTPKGVIIANYRRSGDVVTGTAADK